MVPLSCVMCRYFGSSHQPGGRFCVSECFGDFAVRFGMQPNRSVSGRREEVRTVHGQRFGGGAACGGTGVQRHPGSCLRVRVLSSAASRGHSAELPIGRLVLKTCVFDRLHVSGNHERC